jgi:hypothetical protein
MRTAADAIAALVAERDRLAAANAELREDAAQDLEQITVERDAAVAQIARMKIAFKCERGHGTCSQIHDEGSPYHEPCDATNCQAMIDAAQEPKP